MSLPRLTGRPPGAGAYTSLGSFNKIINLMQASARAASGAPGPLSPYATGVWAAIRSTGVLELNKAQQIAQKVSHLVTIMYMPGVRPDMLVQYLDAGLTRIFKIVDIEDPDERHVELRMLCQEVGLGT